MISVLIVSERSKQQRKDWDNEAMWQKKNPYLEYMIVLLRGQKEGIQLGDSEIRGPKTSEPASEGESSGS